MPPPQSLDGTHYRILNSPRAMRGRRLLPAIKNVAVVVDHTGRDPGAADVDADGR
jgi:hypothetical protein